MRKFEVTLTFKPRSVESVSVRNVFIKQQKVLDVELDDESCISPEQFCDNVLKVNERTDIVRMNIKENFSANKHPLHWLSEHFGRIYFYNGIPIVFHRN
ncbi:MAG: hypothetical protein KJN64_04460 [Ignavibacteria bacterium]|nr:hypothetical protein [Ignavibacteria bacterium]MBT8383140.1 hypothetical protein [Ignavibacteria bacterium]MBT8391310.1 hypothetical protein [Ignavibacteria bacterium]NNJ53010.1 hypothetical protein [Ignavibacteriaceae bacterium]NNL22628.1 hypothetical protein [Ignavibacteriaceae bacterium]